MKKTKIENDELELGEALAKCERQCQREFRLGRSTSFGRCQEKHLQPSARAERKGRALLSQVKIGRTKKMFCQWCAKMVMDDMQFAQNVSQGIQATVGVGGV